MTTIAYRDGVMAADTQIASDYAMHAPKIFRLPDGGIAGGSGAWTNAYAGIKWLLDGEIGEPPSIEEADILIVRPDGTLWKANDKFPAYPLLDKVAAIGCGSLSAIVAMRGGASAVDAVKAVAAVDIYTGEAVQSMQLSETHEYPEAVTHASAKRRR